MRTRWSGRWPSPARQWSDRAVRRRARRGSKIPEHDRSFLRPVLLYLKSREPMLMAGASGVKAVREFTRSSKRFRVPLGVIRKNRSAFSSRKVVLVFRGAVGGGSLAALAAHPVQ